MNSLNRIAHWLPTQNPLKDFIHHNTLHAFQHLPFHEALLKASEVFGAQSYMPLSWYQKAFREGAISKRGLERALGGSLGLEKFLQEKEEDSCEPGWARSGIRSEWRQQGVDLDSLVQPLLFRMTSMFLDQGICIWRMPHAGHGFWEAVRRLVFESYLPFVPLSDRDALSDLEKTPEEAISICLERIVGKEELYEKYVNEMLLSHPGWSGMVSILETNPQFLLAPRSITLQQWVALELVLEKAWLLRKLGPSFKPLEYKPKIEKKATIHRRKYWQEAMEWTYYENVLLSLENHPPSSPSSPSVQAFFCIDDRSCSIRRHLEEVDPSVETLSVPGFFGIDCLFQKAHSAYPVQQCPILIQPKHLIREQVEPAECAPLLWLFHWGTHSNRLFRGWLLTQVLGVWALFRLAWNVFRPGAVSTRDSTLSRGDWPVRLELLRTQDTPNEDGYWVGYSIEEMADRVQSVLTEGGVTQNFCNLILLIAHGSSSANNPHFSAYDCGACSGRPGAPNSIAFAWMANNADVRQVLRSRGFVIPNSCFFVGAMHDTSRDEIAFFDTDLPKTHQPLLNKFRKNALEALKRNAQERCRKFELVPPNMSPEQALEHVQFRASSLFEPRPEYNHATNALCIVGRRALTRGLFLDRRAFLNSYDPTIDSTGDILFSILSAAVPVCAGINLEYFFSKVDNRVYGAGTKLPHNVVSLLGVSTGVDGDLQTGLPLQMVEIHDPLRLLMVVEQEPDFLLKVIRRNEALYEWFKNDWVRLVSFSPGERRSYYLKGESFSPVFSWGK